MAARNSGAEVLPDAGDVNAPEDAGSDINEATGLSAEDQAAFDAMSRGEEIPGDAGPQDGDDGGPDGDSEEVDGSDGENPETPAEPAIPKEKTPAEIAAEATQPKAPQTKKTVSLGKYQRELRAAEERATLAQQEAQKERDNRIKLAERVAIINEALMAQPAQQPQVDPNAPPANPFQEEDIDPTVDYAESVKQIQRRQRFQMEHQGQIEQSVSESREDQELKNTFERDFRTRAGTAEGIHLPQAYQFLKDARLTQIFLSEFDKDPSDPAESFTKDEISRAIQIFNAEEKWLVSNAVKNGKSPALAIEKQAKIYGFKAAPAAPAVPAVPAARPAAPARQNGAPPQRQAPAAPNVADQLAALAAAQELGRSLSDGGGAPPQGLSAELILQLGDEEFADLVDNLPKHQLDSLMGRLSG